MDPVQEQLEAYNAHDVDRFLACYAPDVVMEDAEGRVQSRGVEEARPRYAALFARNPGLHCELLNRIRVGRFVIDEERITGAGPEPLHAVAIYRVEGDRIAHVRFLR